MDGLWLPAPPDFVVPEGFELRTLYITESLSGDILMAKVPVAGKTMYGLS